MYEDILSQIAIYGSIVAVGAIIGKDRFPEQWQILFPTKQQQYETKTKQLQIENKKLELLKTTLIKFKDEKSKFQSLTKDTNDLAIEISKMEIKVKSK